MRLFVLIFLTLILDYNFVSGNSNVCVNNISITNELASKQNWGGDCDSNGFMYFANSNGLLEYNGATWNLYILPDRQMVRSVKVDRKNGIIYTGSYQEFGYWQRTPEGKLIYHSISESVDHEIFSNDDIWKIVLFKNKIYFQSFSNIFIYDGKSIETISPANNMVFLLKARNRLFIHLQGKGLYEIVDDNFVAIPGGEIFSGSIVRVVLPFGKNEFLIGSSNLGLYLFDGKKITEWKSQIQKQIKGTEINAGILCGDKYYIGTLLQGLFIFNPEGKLIRHLNASNLLQNNTVLDLVSDNTYNIWLSLDKGIDIVSAGNRLIRFKTQKNTLGSVYSAALYDGNLFIATNKGVYYHPFPPDDYSSIDPYLFKTVKKISGQTWNLSIRSSKLLCGNNEGSYQINNVNDPQRISNVAGGYNFLEFYDIQNRYLLQSSYSTLNLFSEDENNNWKIIRKYDEFFEPLIDIVVCDDRYIWGSHLFKGAYRIHLTADLSKIESIDYYGINKGLPSQYNIRLMKIGSRVCFTTSDGIYIYDDIHDTIIKYESQIPLLKEYFSAKRIIPAGNECYWFVKGKSLALFRINQKTSRLLFRYDLSQDDESLVEVYENIVPLNDSLFVLCFENGFGILNIKINKERDVDQHLVFTEIALRHGEKQTHLFSIEGKEKITIPYGRNEIMFSFTMTNQTNKNIFYSWKLNHYDTRWTEPSAAHTAVYANLPWGNYKLSIHSFDETGKIRNTLTAEFHVNAPWYLTKIAVLFYLTGLFLMIFLTYKFTSERIKRKKELEMRRKEEELAVQKNIAREEIMNLRNENLSKELVYKSKELAVTAMSNMKNKEVLLKIKEEIILRKQKSGSGYPNSLYNELIKIIDANLTNKDEWEVFENNFNHSHDNFFTRLKTAYSFLSPSDLRLCAFLKLNLTSKEIAPFLNISIKGVEMHRYRLRKKLKLATEDNLIDFIMKY